MAVGGDSHSEEWWEAAQEQQYTLTNLNDVYESFQQSTVRLAENEDNLIHQYWKFYSHNSFAGVADCIFYCYGARARNYGIS
jgi:hypothetical protein